METIYVDRLFVINLIVDYLLTLGAAVVCGVKLRRKRYALAALFGAVYAVLSVLPQLIWLEKAPVKLAAGILMALIAFGGEERLLRCTAVFFAVSAFFGGAVWAISTRSGINRGHTAYIPVSMPVLALSFGICYAALSLVFRRAAKTAGRHIREVRVTYGGNTAELRALDDSGNTLFDPMTGGRVLISSAKALSPLFPGCGELLSGDAASAVSAVPGLRLIPYSAVGTQSGLLPAFRPDELYADGKKCDDVIVAISPTQIGGDGFDSVI